MQLPHNLAFSNLACGVACGHLTASHDNPNPKAYPNSNPNSNSVAIAVTAANCRPLGVAIGGASKFTHKNQLRRPRHVVAPRGESGERGLRVINQIWLP